MNISCLIPTKGDPKKLSKVVNNILDKSKCKEKIEILLKMDSEDADWWFTFNDLTKPFSDNITISCFVSEKGGGWEDLGKFFNYLAKASSGKWLWVLNDDIEIQTQNYDDIIMSFQDKPCVINTQDQGICLFPIVNRKFYNILGRIALDENPHVDTYLQDVAGGSRTLVRTNKIGITHLSEPPSSYGETSQHYYSNTIQNIIKVDIHKIKVNI